MDLCSYAVKTGERRGADEIEAAWIKDVYTVVGAESDKVNNASKTRNEGLRIRVIKDKALSSVFTYNMSKEGVREAVEKAVAAASASKKDENWDSLPSPGKYPRVDVWDSSLENVGSEDLMEPLCEMIQLLPEDISALFAFNEVEISERACVNSSGIEHEDRGALENYGIAAVGKSGKGVTPEFLEFVHLRTYNPDPQKVAESITAEVNLFKNTDTASSGKFPIILAPQATQWLFYSTISKALSGDNVARGKSLFAEKEGEKIASSQLTLHDNGIIRKGVNSREMDDEGVPRQDTPLIENGILQGFLWNDYWAKCTGSSNTGNAQFQSRVGEMSIQQTTMTIEPGDYTKEELFDIKDGYYVLDLQGVHGANPESGDFSVVCSPGYRIRNGEISGGVTEMMISDNVFSLLTKIDALGKEPKVTQVAILPHLRFADVNVAAR